MEGRQRAATQSQWSARRGETGRSSRSPELGGIDLHDELLPHPVDLLNCVSIAISVSERTYIERLLVLQFCPLLVLASLICFSVWIHAVLSVLQKMYEYRIFRFAYVNSKSAWIPTTYKNLGTMYETKWIWLLDMIQILLVFVGSCMYQVSSSIYFMYLSRIYVWICWLWQSNYSARFAQFSFSELSRIKFGRLTIEQIYVTVLSKKKCRTTVTFDLYIKTWSHNAQGQKSLFMSLFNTISDLNELNCHIRKHI